MDQPTDGPDNVVTHARFAGKGDRGVVGGIAGLKANGITVKEKADLSSLELSDPMHDEEVIDTLTDDEQRLYGAFYEAHKSLDTMQRTIGGEYFKSMGQAIQNRSEEDFLQGSMASMNEEQAAKLFQLQRRVEYLKATFFWSLCERIGYHDWFLSVRSKGRVVRIRRKW